MFDIKNHYTESEAYDFVHKCEEAFFKRLNSVSEEITEDKSVSIIGLTGPTCSGKTTMANILINKLSSAGRRVHVISLDDFFLERDVLDSMNTSGEIDYDSPDTIDISLLSKCAEQIIRGERVLLPKYDFLTGKRVEGEIIDGDDDDIYIFEGIQVLYPNVASLLKKNDGYRSIYISPRSDILANGIIFKPNYIRLLRRIVRDYNFRGAFADFTLYLWESVRANEDEFIIPNANSCDYIIDSTLGYDINMLAPYLKKILSLPHSKRGKISEDEYKKAADEILSNIEGVSEMSKDMLLQGSLYTEFI